MQVSAKKDLILGTGPQWIVNSFDRQGEQGQILMHSESRHLLSHSVRSPEAASRVKFIFFGVWILAVRCASD